MNSDKISRIKTFVRTFGNNTPSVDVVSDFITSEFGIEWNINDKRTWEYINDIIQSSTKKQKCSK